MYDPHTHGVIEILAWKSTHHPLREGVREAVAKCKNTGICMTMCTGDDVLTAWLIVQQCNTYTPRGIILEGPYMRLPDIMKAITPRLQVLAQSFPQKSSHFRLQL